MTTQPEALLEAELIAQLSGMGYGHLVILNLRQHSRLGGPYPLKTSTRSSVAG